MIFTPNFSKFGEMYMFMEGVDGRTVGWTDGRTDGVDGWMDGGVDNWMDVCMYE